MWPNHNMNNKLILWQIHLFHFLGNYLSTITSFLDHYFYTWLWFFYIVNHLSPLRGVKLDESLLSLRMRTSFRTWFRSGALNPKPRAFCYFRWFLCVAMANASLSTTFALNVWRYSVKEGIQCGASGEHGCGGAWKRSREAAVEVRSRDGKLWECVYETCVRERLRFLTSPRRLRRMQVFSGWLWAIINSICNIGRKFQVPVFCE
jgi:hypothetical protein